MGPGVEPPPPPPTKLPIFPSKAKQCTVSCDYDRMPVTRGHMRAQYPLLMAHSPVQWATTTDSPPLTPLTAVQKRLSNSLDISCPTAYCHLTSGGLLFGSACLEAAHSFGSSSATRSTLRRDCAPSADHLRRRGRHRAASTESRCGCLRGAAPAAAHTLGLLFGYPPAPAIMTIAVAQFLYMIAILLTRTFSGWQRLVSESRIKPTQLRSVTNRQRSLTAHCHHFQPNRRQLPHLRRSSANRCQQPLTTISHHLPAVSFHPWSSTIQLLFASVA